MITRRCVRLLIHEEQLSMEKDSDLMTLPPLYEVFTRSGPHGRRTQNGKQ